MFLELSTNSLSSQSYRSRLAMNPWPYQGYRSISSGEHLGTQRDKVKAANPLQQVGGRLADDRFIAVLKERPEALVPPIETHGVPRSTNAASLNIFRLVEIPRQGHLVRPLAFLENEGRLNGFPVRFLTYHIVHPLGEILPATDMGP
jgi:hypothetical protein